MPSAKKARISLSNEQVSLQEKLLNVCKDEIGASKTEIPINKKVLSSAESMEPSQVSDKENHSDKSMEDTRLKKSDRRGKDRKKVLLELFGCFYLTLYVFLHQRPLLW